MNDYDGKVVIVTELDTKSVDAQVTKLEKDLETMVKALETDMKIPVELRMNKDERIKLENDIEKTKNRIISLKESMQDTGDEADKTTAKISKGFKKGTTTLKRFALSLFGIHSMYRLLSKASSAYLSQDTELAQKLQNVWVGLGSFLEPLLNAMSNVLLKGLGYLNVFVKALTGVDYIARANAKALNKQTEAQKDLNKATQDYDFDVIRRQQDLSSKGAGGTDFSGIEIPELDDRVVKKLQDLAKWLKENENLVKAVGIALGVTFGAIAIAKLLSNIGSLIGSAKAGTGLAGLSGILKVLGTIGVITISVALLYSALTGRDLIKDLKDIYNGIKDINCTKDDALEYSEKALEENKKWAEEMKNTDEAIKNKSIPDLQEMTENIGNFTDNIAESNTKLIENTDKLNENSKEYETNMNKIQSNNARLEGYKNLLENIKNRLENENKELDSNSDKYKENQELLEQVNGTLDKINGYTATATAYVEMKSNTDNFFSSLWSQLKSGFKSIGDAFSVVFGNKKGKTKGYALGGIVTQPTRALIGEAGYPEAVVPMTQDYLSTLASEIGKYSGGNKGGVTNIYLDGRLIQRQVQNVQNDKDFAGNT